MEAITASARQVATPAHITGPGVLPPPMRPMIIDVTPKERTALSECGQYSYKGVWSL